MNIKKMYQRGRAIQDISDGPQNHSDPWNDPEISSEAYDIGQPFSKPLDETKQLIVYVHGINSPGGQGTAYESWLADSETIFKRLWHHGYKGRLASFKWLALTPASPFKYNESEYWGWLCGRGLTQFVNTLPESNGYKKNLYSFSQGATVCGSALTAYGLSVDNYILSQAAVPAGCYDTSVPINSYPDFLDEETLRPTPNFSADLGYGSYLCAFDANISGSVVSLFNTGDYALKTGKTNVGGVDVNSNWEANEIDYKPNLFSETSYTYTPSLAIGQRCKLVRGSIPQSRLLTSIYESMAFVARPRSEAAGANGSVGGSIGECYNVGGGSPSNFGLDQSDHSGQFSRRIQSTWSYYLILISVFTEE